jgi:hypothetical protein
LNKTASEDPYLVHSLDCAGLSDECHLEEFLSLLQKLIPTNRTNECHNDKDSLNSGTSIDINYFNETQSENPYFERFLYSVKELIPTNWTNERHNDEDSLNSKIGIEIDMN